MSGKFTLLPGGESKLQDLAGEALKTAANGIRSVA